MTATIALTAAEAEAIARARAALAWIRADSFPWPGWGGRQITETAESLSGCLDDYTALTTGERHPADLFEDLGRGQDNAMELALDLVTQDIRDWTGALVDLARKAEDAARDREALGGAA